ncbi:MAG: hypothetical protein KDA73_13945 [Rhodobacteraceae bacterium]|nr:hypothetical protein [Paracoccaceae bacterium]
MLLRLSPVFALVAVAACDSASPGPGTGQVVNAVAPPANLSTAEAACVQHLNDFNGGPGARVTSTSQGASATTVGLTDLGGAKWSCRAGSDGAVQSFSVVN